MAVSIVSAVTNHNVSGTIGAGVPATFAYTVPATTTLLAVIEMTGSGAPAVPTAMSYNSAAMTNVTGSFVQDTSGGNQCSIWYLASPTTGSSLTFSVTYTQTIGAGGYIMLVPLIGVNLSSPVGTAHVAHDSGGSSTAPANNSVLATANDLQLCGLCLSYNPTTVTDPGGNQTNQLNANSRGSTACAADSAAGNASGVFAWTLSVGSFWASSGVAFIAPPAGAVIAWVV